MNSMIWCDPQQEYMIPKATGQSRNGECTLNWDWPKNVQYVYIASYRPDEEPVGQPDESWLSARSLKLVTREEYKIKAGYRDRADFIGMKIYRLFPCIRTEEGELEAFLQWDDHNMVRISGGKAEIRYKVRYGKGWFQKLKPVTLELFCEIPVSEKALCYVKKKGSEPVHKDDGVVYLFNRTFEAGQTRLPEIQIAKDEYVRLFFTDGKAYGTMYELMKE
jgi:hypothetical protein